MQSTLGAPPLLLKSEDKLLIVLSHLSAFLGVGLLFPLVVYLVKKSDGPVVAWHAREALNFHISVFIYLIVCVPLVFVIVGVFFMLGIGLAAAVLAVIAAIQSADGSEYRYPLTIRLVQ